MRLFRLERSVDVSGISGTGIVAEGVQFTDGKVAFRWTVGDSRCVSFWDSLGDVKMVHGHEGSTKVVWVSDEC